jgi:ABC-type multidrug transport system fused ATPase/permease subunit
LWQAAAAGLERLRTLFDMRPTIVAPLDPQQAGVHAPEIMLNDVSLTYGDMPVLNGASFVAEAGKTTALVGASGAGKSTVFNVLTRLAEPMGGVIAIDDVPIDAFDLGDLRGMFSVVTQDALLFDETIRENILLGRTDVSEKALQAAIRDAHVADFLPKLSAGLDTPVGPRGSALSGGQRQRVAIARALLRNTPILLLDEATSALDAASEAVVQKALERLSQGRTTLVIAHRLSTIQNADKIVVMDKGRVIEEGTHDVLLAKGGAYSDLYNLQFRSMEE